jgi:hypothetical protein
VASTAPDAIWHQGAPLGHTRARTLAADELIRRALDVAVYWMPALTVARTMHQTLFVNNQKRVEKKPVPAAGYDGSGHMNPEHARRLLEMAREGKVSDGSGAFIDAPETQDDLAEGLAEAAVSSMTSGEDQLGPDLDSVVDEEVGGPFVETSGNTEFAGGTDESNIPEATREPFPKT